LILKLGVIPVSNGRLETRGRSSISCRDSNVSFQFLDEEGIYSLSSKEYLRPFDYPVSP